MEKLRAEFQYTAISLKLSLYSPQFLMETLTQS